MNYSQIINAHSIIKSPIDDDNIKSPPPPSSTIEDNYDNNNNDSPTNYNNQSLKNNTIKSDGIASSSSLVSPPLYYSPSIFNLSDGEPGSPTVISPIQSLVRRLRPITRPGLSLSTSNVELNGNNNNNNNVSNIHRSNNNYYYNSHHNISPSASVHTGGLGGTGGGGGAKTPYPQSLRGDSDEDEEDYESNEIEDKYSIASSFLTNNIHSRNIIRGRSNNTVMSIKSTLPSVNSISSMTTITRQINERRSIGGGGGGKIIIKTESNSGVKRKSDAPLLPLTVADFQHMINQRIQEFNNAKSILLNSNNINNRVSSEVQMLDNTEINMKEKRSLDILENEKNVNDFIELYLSTNGYDKALRLFKKRRPLADQKLHTCLSHFQKDEDISLLSKTLPDKKIKTSLTPSYNLNKDDLTLMSMETIRQEQLLNDTISWRQINCRRKDYKLEPLSHHQQYHDQNGTKKEDFSQPSAMAVGGSLDLLIEVLILVETDTPFITGMPIFNFTNTFILLSSLFVFPEVLMVRLIRLFHYIRNQLSLEDNRCVFLLRRIIQFMIAYCKYHEVDLTYSLLYRLQKFIKNIEILNSLENSSSHSKLNNNNDTPLYSEQKMRNLYPLSMEVMSRIKELSIFIDDIIHKMFIITSENNNNLNPYWQQRNLKIVLKPLGTIIKGIKTPNEVQIKENFKNNLYQNYKSINSIITDIKFISIDAEILADQMCLLSFRIFSNIHIREILNNAWCNNEMNSSVPFNLKKFIDYSSNIQRWIAALIVKPIEWLECQKIMQHCLRICRILYDKQNYEISAAVLAGLQHPSVTILEKLYFNTFHQCILNTFEQGELTNLQDLMNPFASQESPSSLRSISNRITGDMEAPMIPLLAPVLGVMFRTEESKGKTITISHSDGIPVINWSKIVALGKTIFLWLRCQSTPYEFVLNDTLQHYLWQIPGHEYSDATLTSLAKHERVKT